MFALWVCHLSSCVALGTLLSLSEPQFTHLSNGNSAYCWENEMKWHTQSPRHTSWHTTNGQQTTVNQIIIGSSKHWYMSVVSDPHPTQAFLQWPFVSSKFLRQWQELIIALFLEPKAISWGIVLSRRVGCRILNEWSFTWGELEFRGPNCFWDSHQS